MDTQSADSLISDSLNREAKLDTIYEMVVEGLLPGTPLHDDEDESDKPRRFPAPTKAKLFELRAKEFIRKYFPDNSAYDQASFQRRFRIPRSVLERLAHGLYGRRIFVRRRNTLQKEGITPLLKIISSLRVHNYGKPFEDVREVWEMSKTSVQVIFKCFIREVIAGFAEEYL